MSVDASLTQKSFGVGGVRMWGHGGNTFGFKSLVMYLPDEHATIAVSINDDNDKGLASLFSALLQVVNADLHR